MTSPTIACPACGALPRYPCNKLTDESFDAKACERNRPPALSRQPQPKAAGGVPASNGRVGTGTPPTGRLYGQPAPTGGSAAIRPSWMLEPDTTPTRRREHDVHLDPRGDLKPHDHAL